MLCGDYYTEFPTFADRFTNVDNVQLLRGGTQMLHHSNGIYFGIAHTRFARNDKRKTSVYRPVLLVMVTEPRPKLYFPPFPIELYDHAGQMVNEDVINPVATFFIGTDGAPIVSLSIGDHHGVLARVDGVNHLLNSVGSAAALLQFLDYNEKGLSDRFHTRYDVEPEKKILLEP